MNRRGLFGWLAGALATPLLSRSIRAETTPTTVDELNAWFRREFRVVDCRDTYHVIPKGMTSHANQQVAFDACLWRTRSGSGAERKVVRAAFDALAPYAGKGHTVYLRVGFIVRDYEYGPYCPLRQDLVNSEYWTQLTLFVATLEFPLPLCAEGYMPKEVL